MLRNHWTEEEVKILEDSYPNSSSKDIAIHLQRTPKSIISKAGRLGIRAQQRCYSFPKAIQTLPISESLSYLIGAIKGDGCTFKHKQMVDGRLHTSYVISVSMVDFEFAKEVQECFKILLERTPKIYQRNQSKSSTFPFSKILSIRICDKSLHHVLSKSIEELKPYIEAYPAEFLRGFFDAEGSAWKVRNGEPVVKYCNTNLALIECVRELLIRLRIKPAPRTFDSKGNLGKAQKTCYNIHIYRKDSVKRFMEIVGSCIPRKRLVV